MKERRKSLLSNEKMVSYTGSSIGSTHKQHSHTMKTQKINGVGKMEVLFK